MTRIVTAGLAVVDFVFYVDEMPRRAEKYRAREAQITGGGCAANAAAAVSRLGGEALLATRLGDDQVGDMIVAGLDADGVDCALAYRFEGCRSSFSSVLVDQGGERQIVNFRDHTLPMDADWLIAALPNHFDAALADTRWPEGAAALMRTARERGVPGVLDAEAPVMDAEEALRLASHLAFSAQGLRDWAGHGDLDAALDAVACETRAFVCVTDGARGVFWIHGQASGFEPAYQIEAVDTLGAGDVWHGAFALALGEKMQPAPAIRFANSAAALKCTRSNGRAGYPRRSEAENFMKEAMTCS
ncbi:Sugar kinase, ribokinase family [Hoeflea phototrophica DFL-43]|uniref:Sugar kinase, ribokinase family n=1 Tax=Hoeflea phototrophica (strain DSM 17068 / NCIMB 14078 / DFL-43) TaxID=411684 RepID=A9D846_HOEPD|nr:PfkB family carbohydrate kinase [Hoeflea phototrophica]EDQ33220.1 Sugar kinase, ribokinase family [Hoeflea phototrophica DFL-43]